MSDYYQQNKEMIDQYNKAVSTIYGGAGNVDVKYPQNESFSTYDTDNVDIGDMIALEHIYTPGNPYLYWPWCNRYSMDGLRDLLAFIRSHKREGETLEAAGERLLKAALLAYGDK